MEDKNKKYVDVAVSMPVKGLFTYEVPEVFKEKIKPGLMVLVPFKNRLITGYVFGECKDKPNVEIKEISDIIGDEPVLTPELIELAQWISEYYLCPLGEVFRTMLPKGIEKKSMKIVHLNYKSIQESISGIESYSEYEKKILEKLMSKKSLALKKLKKIFDEKIIDRALEHFQKDGIIEISKKLMEPKVKIKFEDYVKLKNGFDYEKLKEKINKRAKSQINIVENLKNSKELIKKSDLLKKAAGNINALKSLIKKEIVEIFSKEILRKYPIVYGEEYVKPEKLTDEQSQIIDEIKGVIKNNLFNVFLLYGVTGSGKTQVYIELISEVVKKGKGVIMLVPEISLTSQAVNRLNSYFEGNVSFLHSHMSPGEKYDYWRKIRDGDKKLVVGPRSAVFAPVKNLGLIIVDEEHDNSYKQSESAPRYNAKDAAIMRGKINNCPVILGSATPIMESYYNSQIGKYKLVKLTRRIDNIPMPKVKIVNLLKEKMENKIFSEYLSQRIVERLRRGEQVILLQNRRGFSTFIQCRDCGFIERCRNCNITLTYHKDGYRLRCHYCGYSKEAPSRCPNCLGKNVYYSGVGTQRVHGEIKRIFPEDTVIRMDADSTTKKGSHSEITAQFEKGLFKILLGTQMISKGFDFPNVNLVGVISADTGLLIPDFRANEKTFQLLTQVAGRAGRRKIRGEVIIQTYLPENYSIKSAVKQDFEEFYKLESEIRSQLNYPPFGRLILIGFKGEKERELISASGKFADILNRNKGECQIFGPAPSPLSKIKKKFRWQILVKGKRIYSKKMRNLVEDSFGIFRERYKFKNVTINIDVDPVNMM